MSDDGPSPLHVDPQSHGAPRRSFRVRQESRERLRLIDLFVWTAVVAMCLAGARWFDPLVAYDLPLAMRLWIAITFGTALCSWPWYVSRLRDAARFPLLPGERLWLFMVIVMSCRLLFEAGVMQGLILGEWMAFPVLAFLAVARQPVHWRVAFSVLGMSWLIAILVLLARWESQGWFEWWLAGKAMAWSAPVVAIALVGDVISPSRGELRWSHWVGGIAFLSWLSAWYFLYERVHAHMMQY